MRYGLIFSWFDGRNYQEEPIPREKLLNVLQKLGPEEGGDCVYFGGGRIVRRRGHFMAKTWDFGWLTLGDCPKQAIRILRRRGLL